MKYCKRCLYPSNHPYGMIFDKSGVCMGCRIHEEKDHINWDLRFKLLKKIVEQNIKDKFKNNFDCIIPVTGGGDSYFIVDIVKNKLGLNPLLVNYNSHYNTKIGIRNLANLTTVFDCDILTSTLNPDLLKRITRYTLKKFGNMYWQALAGYLTFPVQVAVKYKIPLIFWGVHPWSEQTGMFSHLDEAEMTARCRKEHGLMGINGEDLININDGISRKDIQPFIYPFDNELEKIGVRGIYLSNYIRWDSKTQHECMIKKYGYETAPQQRTFNTYEDVHCFHSAGLHDYLKFLKLGYSKVTDHACREIRLRRMTREEGIEQVRKYTFKEPEDIDIFLNWLGMEKKEFFSLITNRRDKRIWQLSEQEWILKDNIANHINDEGIDKVRLEINGKSDFLITESREPNAREKNYLLMGRGYLDKFNYGAIEDQPAEGKFLKGDFDIPKIY